MVITAKAIFLAEQIRKGKITYLTVIVKHPQLQEQIDAYIEQKGYTINKNV